ncbi:MAG: phospholipid/cholesterol/gamma-HCH transport system substrate-binding protein, partial [Actinomycetota bacterium]|nr:phospholipid/cholesterol/gamma-HCH transport system substrate-binding protein [Actinomycetota bacterium]
VRVGKVGSLHVERGKAIVGIKIDDRHRVPKGSTFELRWKNLLGQRFIEIVPPAGAAPGGPSLAEGTHVPSGQTAEAADLSTLLNNTEPILARLDTASLNRVMSTYAAAMQGREATLNHSIDDAAALVATLSQRADVIGRSVTDFATLLDGIAAHDAQVRQLLDSMGSTSAVLSAKADQLGQAAGKAGQFTSTLSRILAANGTNIDKSLDLTKQLTEAAVRNKGSLEKAFQTLPWTTAAMLRMTSNGDWIQSYTRAVGFVDAYASEPRVGPDYNNVGPDDPQGPEPVLGQPRVPLPPIPRTDAGVIAINPAPGSSDSSGLSTLFAPLMGKQ